MTLDNIEIAMAECRRFMKAAEVAAKALRADQHYMGGKPTATCKRASLDLSQALADMRGRGRQA